MRHVELIFTHGPVREKSLPTFDDAGRLMVEIRISDLEPPKPLKRPVVTTVIETHPGLN